MFVLVVLCSSSLFGFETKLVDITIEGRVDNGEVSDEFGSGRKVEDTIRTIVLTRGVEVEVWFWSAVNAVCTSDSDDCILDQFMTLSVVELVDGVARHDVTKEMLDTAVLTVVLLTKSTFVVGGENDTFVTRAANDRLREVIADVIRDQSAADGEGSFVLRGLHLLETRRRAIRTPMAINGNFR